MSPGLVALACLLGAYLAGSVPTGVLLGRLAGRDPRTAGSGNIGATNVTRTMGKAFGAVTLLVDVVKGLVPTLVAAEQGVPWLAAGAGLLATLGHCYPVWLRFRGGKGVATAFGAMAALAWPVAVVAALIWVVAAILTRTPAAGSLAAAVAFVGLSFWDARPHETQLLALLLALLIVLRHQSNITQMKARPRPPRTRRTSKPNQRSKP
jgi:glycerol-3-phosphate acyltransferase PlsY